MWRGLSGSTAGIVHLGGDLVSYRFSNPEEAPMINLRPDARRLRLLVGCALLTFPVQAQVPEHFTNLQVLPVDIPRGELIWRMRKIAGALGVRCNDCHVGENTDDLGGYDFASDAKELKQTARKMLRITAEINETLLPQLGKDRAELVEVGCRTCHHGQRRPQALLDVLRATVESEGAEAAIAQYRELRARHYGRDTFDFGEWQLFNFANDLVQSEQVEAAYAFIQLNLELNPDFVMNHVFLGRYYAHRGETEEAIAAYERALELDPSRAPFFQRSLDELRSSRAEPGAEP